MVAYIIFARLHTRNRSELDLYKKQAPVFLAGHSIKWLANFGPYEVLEGPGVEGIAILEFPTAAEAKAWYESPAYQAASLHRFRGGDYSAIIVEGIDPVTSNRNDDKRADRSEWHNDLRGLTKS